MAVHRSCVLFCIRHTCRRIGKGHQYSCQVVLQGSVARVQLESLSVVNCT